MRENLPGQRCYSGKRNVQHGASRESWFVSTSREVTLPKRPRVLIAEDHAGVAKAVCRLLAVDCDVVGSVADGNAVLGAAQRLQPDVIVVDLNLPNVHGLEACRLIKQMNPETKVIIFSAMNDPSVIQRSLEVGASAFVSKGTGDLLSTIKRVCDDRG
jgi:DNA-binding NarL/FixJ family response regulator